MLLGQLGQDIIIELFGLRVNTVVDKIIIVTGVVDLHAVGQMTAVV